MGKNSLLLNVCIIKSPYRDKACSYAFLDDGAKTWCAKMLLVKVPSSEAEGVVALSQDLATAVD